MGDDYKSVISDKKDEAKKLMSDDQIAACNVAIHTAAVAAGTAGAIPIPVADAIPISGAQITMAIALGKIFDQQLSETAAKALISAVASTFVGRTIVKMVPVVGWVVSAAVAAGVTEAVGWTLAVDFAKKSQILSATKKNEASNNQESVKMAEEELALIERTKKYTEDNEKDDDFWTLLDEISDYINTHNLDKDSELWSEYNRILNL